MESATNYPIDTAGVLEKENITIISEGEDKNENKSKIDNNLIVNQINNTKTLANPIQLIRNGSKTENKKSKKKISNQNVSKNETKKNITNNSSKSNTEKKNHKFSCL